MDIKIVEEMEEMIRRDYPDAYELEFETGSNYVLFQFRTRWDVGKIVGFSYNGTLAYRHII